GRTKMPPDTLTEVHGKRQEVFFESRNLMLSGRLWTPAGIGAFPAVLLVPEDGPMRNGEQSLFEALGRRLSSSGIAVLDFDSPGQGKSQGNFRELDDGKRIRDIKAAVSFLGEHPSVNGEKITVIGYGGGGYLAMKAVEQAFPSVSCICLGVPLDSEVSYTLQGLSIEGMHQMLAMHGLGRFDNSYMKTVCDIMKENLTKIKGSNEDSLFFMSKKLPLKACREYLDRKPYDTIIALKRPLLMIFGKDGRNFRPKAVESLKSLLADRGEVKIAVFRNLGTYMEKREESGENGDFNLNEDVVQLIKARVTGPGMP
ncbi:MAG: alpha/beta hydrolase, partial [Candidatus Omnitrophica bacterium]|nr:alpha/beta hydrolase [Candidatus Omnitrophota bacterium]